MALNEACQVWIEQRIQEELDGKADTGVSYRKIGREIAAEIDKLFQAKVDPETIRKRAERRSGTNVPGGKRSLSPRVNQAKGGRQDHFEEGHAGFKLPLGYGEPYTQLSAAVRFGASKWLPAERRSVARSLERLLAMVRQGVAA